MGIFVRVKDRQTGKIREVLIDALIQEMLNK